MVLPVSKKSADALAAKNGGNLVGGCPAPAKPKPPTVKMGHILKGEVNGSGNAVGFHHRPGGVSPQGSQIGPLTKGPNKKGIYCAPVRIYDFKAKAWAVKDGGSTFYPDAMSAEDIEKAIIAAAADATAKGEIKPNGKFTGNSGKGFKIGGYLVDGKITTAYPIFKAD